jgi:hypothetical protein
MENEAKHLIELIGELQILEDAIIANRDGVKYFNGLMAIAKTIGHLDAERILITRGVNYAKSNTN